MWRKLIREPLIHFLGGALLLFAFFWATGSDRDPADYQISIDESDIDRLTTDWVRNFRRAPTQAELDSLIDQEIAEEIYYREALRLGLDKNDPVIRRRLFTKMRFIDSENSENLEPTDALLKQWMDANPGKYALSQLYDFEQVYLGQISTAAASDIVAQLKRGARPETFRKPLSLPATVERVSSAEISRQFGDRFAGELEKLESNVGSGPISSGFGMHAVRITAKAAGKAAALDDVRQQVVNDWSAARQAAQKEAALSRYREQYEISIAGRP
ncbi:peptidyl-prolyl cis-trans isomerase [Parasphingorhabdus sp.]|uniref:peptidylprolyl isomerase n=1 Tax=Parasphingorhabdus sp. TaxID=2709688 RepID=UPI0035943267